MKALVTGGAGFIGSHLVDALLARGASVRVLDNLDPQAHPAGEARFLAREAELIQGDLRDASAVERSLDGIDTVFHLGGMVGNGQSMHEIVRYTQVNVVGTAVLLESVARRRDRVRRLIVASSMVVYGDGAYACAEHGILSVPPARPLERLRARLWEPVCPRCDAEVTPVPITEDRALAPTSTYGITKRDQEELCLVLGRAYGIETIALRYLNTYGSRQALSNPYTGVCAIMAMRLRLGKAPTVFEDGRQLRDPTHVSDVVRATILASEAGDAALYQAFNVGAGEPVSVAEMASALARALGEDIAPHVTAEFRQGDIRHCFADISRAARLLSFQPRVRFEDGARELAEWVSRETPVDHTERANDELRARGLLG